MDEYSVSQCHEEYPDPEPKHYKAPAWIDVALSVVEQEIGNLKVSINDHGPMNAMQTRKVHSLIKDLEHMTRGRWVA